ncbi:MAG: DUF262 domain-containing protein [Okeania sp. SIO3I5]|uniref:DUF262 domain-containing protein n=1 Tax=Okeania sp. SIO3I5 TaxID=2607805 RepID=UPI0013BC8966|nr:DUF262 domain-containing protein [Okeania sp. SIO3I5]NEQ36683.1 DUF262 domain-containing protein [Okeania sp. SIO3I5]
MSLLPIEQKMWQEKAAPKTKNGKSTIDIVAKYHSRENRILTKISREKLPSFAQALMKPGYMDLGPFYQRISRWNKQKQSRLIESFLINIPVPPIILYEESYSTPEVIDGHQRITAIRDFYENKLKLTGLEFWSELNGLTYQEIDSTIKRGIDRRSISIITVVTESKTHPEEAMFLKQLAFERINTEGVDLSKQEVRNCLYDGKMNKLLLELSRHPIFAEAWGIPTEEVPELEKNHLYKKMKDAELVLRFFALRNLDYFRNGMEGFLDLYMIKSQQFSDEDIELLRGIFIETIELAHQLYEEKLFKPFDPKSNTWKLSSDKPYYDALMVGLSRHLANAELLVSQKYRVIEETKNLFQEDKLGILTGAGKNSKADIQKRIELLENILLQVIGE